MKTFKLMLAALAVIGACMFACNTGGSEEEDNTDTTEVVDKPVPGDAGDENGENSGEEDENTAGGDEDSAEEEGSEEPADESKSEVKE